MTLPAAPDLDVKDLYERYGRSVYRRCQYLLRSDEDARDAMHDVFIKVVERGHEFRGQASPLTWMVRIATNHCLNVLRGRRAAWHERYDRTVKVDAAGRGEAPQELEKTQLLRLVLDKAEADVQAAALYYFVDEMTQEDAAAAAGCSVPTLRKRLRRFIEVGRRELKKADADAVFGDSPI